MAATLRDVAARVNLSTSLVSGVLNERVGVWASDETRRRVREAAREMGYHPNRAARALRSGKTQTVALVYVRNRGAGRRGYSDVIEALAGVLYPHQYQLQVQPLASEAEVMDHLIQLARLRSCDLVVLWGSDPEVVRQGDLLEGLGMPFVAKGRHEKNRPHWPQVEFDHEAMMDVAVRRHAAAGHARIAYLGYANGEPYTARLREGFESAVAAHTGRPADPELIHECAAYPQGVGDTFERWFDRPAADGPPTAVVIGASAAWEALEAALARRGRRIGPDAGSGEVAVVGNSTTPLRLLFGTGYVFDVEYHGLASAMAARIVVPLLRAGGPPGGGPVVRVCPEVRATDSHRLIEGGMVRFAAAGSHTER